MTLHILIKLQTSLRWSSPKTSACL